MEGIEQILISILLNFVGREEMNAFLRDPRSAAVIVGALIALSGALLGTFLLLRGMALTSDAISHTVLLGIVVAFLVMTGLLGLEADLSSPWLIIGAAGAGVATVVLTEAIYRSGLVKQDAALGLAFPLLFAVAIILVSRFADDVHLDADSVMVGEIGVAWANTNSHCLGPCETVTVTEDDPRAEITRQCTNCRELGISPRDAAAEFVEVCSNCGTYSAAQAYREGFTEIEPQLVFWPKSITVTGLMALLTVGFVALFYKELKLSTFDAALARSLGFRPGLISYALMVLVSLVAVGAFDAVGSILVIAFFIIPPAAAYLLSDRLGVMLLISPLIGTLGAVFGYDLARGHLFGVIELSPVLAWLNSTFDMALVEQWDTSISASMVLMLFGIFVLCWVLSPKYGLISTSLRRAAQRKQFDDQVVLGHVYNHSGTERAAEELAVDHLHEHFRWTPRKMQRVLSRLQASALVKVDGRVVTLTALGSDAIHTFRAQYLSSTPAPIAG
ncbi:MAG: metal ABC transporter permease [Chloroflexi bacterium]|nr:metal ABC transporter permease [Chloroflexota bacterium]